MKRKRISGGQRPYKMDTNTRARRTIWAANRRLVRARGWIPRRSRINIRTGGFLDKEVKYFDFEVNNQALVAGIAGGEVDPAANCIFYPTQGNAVSNREGRRVLMKSLYVNFIFSADPSSDQADVTDPHPIMVAIVLDTQTNAAQLNAEDVYDDNTTSKTLACRNMEYINRFRVLWVKRFFLTVSGTFTDGANTGSVGYGGRRYTVSKKLNIPVNFVANNGNCTDIMDNSLHVIAWGSAADNIYYRGRIQFVG